MTNASEKSTLSNADLGVSPTMKEEHGARPSAPELLKPDNEDKDSSSEDGFADAPESATSPLPLPLQTRTEDSPIPLPARPPSQHSPKSPPPLPARQLTARTSQPTASSIPGGFASPSEPSSPAEKRSSQSSITPPTTTTGSVHESSSGTAKSPGSSQRRISTASLDEVSLIDELPPSKDPTAPNDTPPAPAAASSLVEAINRFSQSSTKTTSPVRNPPPPPPPPPAPAKRSPFSWLRSSASSQATPPAAANNQVTSRRGTTTSIGSLAAFSTSTAATPSNNELLIHRMGTNRDGDKEKEELLRGMENLRENFKKLREAREYGVEDPTAGTAVTSKGPSDFTPASPEATPPATAKAEDEIDWDLWQAVVDDAFSVASEKPTELNRAIQAGIPPTLRGTVWQSMAASKSLELEVMYREVIQLPAAATAKDARVIFSSHWLWDPSPLSSQASSPRLNSYTSPRMEPKVNGHSPDQQWGKTVAQLEKVIKRDLGDRTSFGKYKVDQKALLNVCKAYALFDPAVGYTQGMTFIATVLLLNMTEEEAFCVFVKLMNKYKLRAMFQEKMKGLELRLYQYDRFLEDYEPKLAIHLQRQHIESSLYAAQWFLTLFTYKFPLQLVLRVFDLLFSEGLEGPILQFGIVLMRKNAPKLLQTEFDTLVPFLKERLFDVYIDLAPSTSSVMEAGFFGNGGEKEIYRANELISDAVGIKISQENLERYEREWDEAERNKREQELELEGLRRSNISLSSKVKKLEEQNEELNREYVRIASSEVGLKVANDQLADENEVLRAKVDGLRDMVDKQPQEVEDRLKGEMEALMQKNLAVHRENQTLEESMMEMEKELVSAKMQLATVNEDYDLLKNRWNDLKKALE